MLLPVAVAGAAARRGLNRSGRAGGEDGQEMRRPDLQEMRRDLAAEVGLEVVKVAAGSAAAVAVLISAARQSRVAIAVTATVYIRGAPE